MPSNVRKPLFRVWAISSNIYCNISGNTFSLLYFFFPPELLVIAFSSLGHFIWIILYVNNVNQVRGNLKENLKENEEFVEEI